MWCDITSSIIWIPLMFSRCCSGRREINTRRKNTFTSKTVSTREGSTCRLTSLARLALQPLHFLAGVLCFTLLSRLWKHFRTPPDKPPRSAGVGGADRWGRKRTARTKKRNLIIHLRVIVKRVALLAVAAGCPNLSVRIFLQLEHKRVSEVQKRCQVLKHVTSVHKY